MDNDINKQNNLFIRTYAFPFIDSRMYVIKEGEKAIVVDPIENREVEKVLIPNEMGEIFIFLTHEHYDHISGVNWFKRHYSCTVICQKRCGYNIEDPTKNLASYFRALFMNAPESLITELISKQTEQYVCKADQTFEDSMDLNWEGHRVHFVATPGHSQGSCCIIFDEQIMFSGDTLVTGNEIVTRLPGGSQKEYQHITVPFLDTLSDELLIYPGHGDCQKMHCWR